MNFAKRFFQVLAITAAIMQVSAHLAPVLAEATGALQITICSGYGTRDIVIDKNGNEVPQPPKKNMQNCMVCSASHAAALTPSIVTVATNTPAFEKVDIEANTLLFAQTPPRAHQTRGPPTLS